MKCKLDSNRVLIISQKLIVFTLDLNREEDSYQRVP